MPVDRFTALATVDVPRRRGAAIGLAAHGPGRVLRGIELRDGRVRAFRSDDRGLTAGSDPARSRRRAAAAGDQRDAGRHRRRSTCGAGQGAPTRIAGGPAQAGLAATRVALTCRGTGATRVDSIHVAATGEAP